MPGMKVFKIVREKLGISEPWKMHKLLGMSSVQRYLYIERSSTKVSLKDLVKLYRCSGMSAKDFWSLIEKEADGKL